MDKNKIALCISGGGFRASLYALGALWRLNEFGILPRLHTVTGVSGGSISSAYLALRWQDLEFNAQGVSENFPQTIAAPLENFCSKTIDTPALWRGLLSFNSSAGDMLAYYYDKHLFRGANIADLAASGPKFVFYGTSLQTGSGFQISRERLHDYKIGDYPRPNMSLAQSVAISSAYPPIMSPVNLKPKGGQWVRGVHESCFDEEAFKQQQVLVDGGLYDNLGLEHVWKAEDSFTHILACDAGAPMALNAKLKTNWFSQLMRMCDIMTEQQRALRKRALIETFQRKDGYNGSYFGISTNIDNYKFADAMTTHNEVNAQLQYLRTRLNHFTETEQGRLINWGYALCDCAVRKHLGDIVDAALLVKGSWPKPKYSV